MSDYLKFLPLALVASATIASGAVDNFRLQAHAQELINLEESMDENEDIIGEIQRLLIKRKGEVELDLELVKREQQDQGEDLEEILLLLRSLDNTLR